MFHLLVKESAIHEGRVPLFMAYDLKQSTDDRALTSVGGAGHFFRALHAGASELVELTKVFRSTPEIARLLELIDGAFQHLIWRGSGKPMLHKVSKRAAMSLNCDGLPRRLKC